MTFDLYLKTCAARIKNLTEKSSAFKLYITLKIHCFHPGMAFTRILSVLLCQLAVFGSVVHSCCLQSSCSADCCKGQSKVIYHQTMTPNWVEAHASYIDSSRTATAQQLTFNAGTVDNAALLKVPMIPAGALNVGTPLTVEITVAHDISIGGKAIDSDIRYGVSDGTKFIGFETCDTGNYVNSAPCYTMEGVSGATLSSRRHEAILPKPSESFYPGQFVFTLKLDERWGSCYTAHDGGFVKTAGYNHRLMLSKGLTLEAYKSDKGERVGIRFIKVEIIHDEA